MKSITEIIDTLNNINSEIIKKDNILSNYRKLYNMINKLINDEQFIKSDNYFILKNNYINDIMKIMSIIEDVPLDSQLLIQVNKNSNINIHTHTQNNNHTNTNNKSQKDESNINNKSQIIKLSNFDPYNTKFSNRIPKINKRVINHKDDYYFLNIKDDKYLFNPNNNKIYDLKEMNIGYIEDNKVYINNEVIYELDTIESIEQLKEIKSYKKLQSDYIII